jgi:hypothetical protein
MMVPRSVRVVPKSDDAPASVAEPLESFRSCAAWVLLGDPGAGKSEALKSEAAATGGQYLRIAEFIHDTPNTSGKTLFLDGLDESRAASSGESSILLIKRQLSKLSNPAFRIACRAADWYGSTDRSDLEAASKCLRSMG